MAHSIELLFDEETERALCLDWTALAEANLPSQARHRSPTNRPHVTLTVSEHIGAAVDAELAEPARQLPFECQVGAPIVFGRKALTLARLVVPSAPLLRIQASVFELAMPHQTPGPLPHTRPGRWTPHVTLCRRLAPADLPAALAAIGSDEVVGTFAAMRRWDGDRRVDHALG